VTTGDTPAASPVWGLIRCAYSEHAGRFAVVDLDRALAALPAAVLASAADAVMAGEQQLAVAGAHVRVARLTQAVDSGLLALPGDPGPWRLATRGLGLLENIEITAAPDAAAQLQPGQVRVAVRSAGLNFHDVLAALGAIPGEECLGFEGAGVVTATGRGVTDLPVGTRVFGLLDGAFASVAVADRRTLMPVPPGWTFTEAAAVPVTYLAAYLALVRVARLREGQTLLVHAAAGGVGMAAVQLGRHFGAEVYGTAAPAKWDALRTLGLDDRHLASSRSPRFESAFRTATGGRGIDLVLNTLAGELTDASLRLLAPRGRLIELGKTDLRDPRAVASEYPGIAYQAINLRDVLPQEIGEMFAEIVELFSRGVLRLPPITSWDIRRAPEAFRVMSKGGHTGKIVLTAPFLLDPQGTVLITGGTGTLAGVVARHLATRYGVRHLVLAGRRGPDAPGMAELCADLAEHGAEVTVSACDVTDRRSLQRLIGEIPASRPLTAVVHAAAVLDDALVSRLTPERLDRVMRPKVEAAWLLHELTRDHDLAAFVLFSSAASLLGQAGQGNYAAANAYLDALATYRRARGLPAHSLAWGIWAGHSGVTARLSKVNLDRFRRFGMAALPADEALAMFDAALFTDDAVPVAIRLDAEAVRTGNGQIPPLLRELIAAPPPRAVEPREPAARSVDTTDLVQLICAETAKILGYSDPDAVTGNRSFKELGADSLAALELRNRISAATGLQIAGATVLKCATPAALAARLRETQGFDSEEA
jgi:NADPH:quinone reductase-like Zn-dependent oxidoreductase/acyl carrier protein